MGLLEGDQEKINNPSIYLKESLFWLFLFLFMLQSMSIPNSIKNAFALCTHYFNYNIVYKKQFLYKNERRLIFINTDQKITVDKANENFSRRIVHP